MKRIFKSIIRHIYYDKHNVVFVNYRLYKNTSLVVIKTVYLQTMRISSDFPIKINVSTPTFIRNYLGIAKNVQCASNT